MTKPEARNYYKKIRGGYLPLVNQVEIKNPRFLCAGRKEIEHETMEHDPEVIRMR